MTKEIRLSPTKVTLVDDDDYGLLNHMRWCFDGRYAYHRKHLRMEGRKQIYNKIYLHKLINKTPEGFDTDHINQDKLDNQKTNLRTASRSQNEINKPKMAGTASIYKGVVLDKRTGKWRAEIKRNGIRKYLGIFISEQDAAEAYNKAAMEFI